MARLIYYERTLIGGRHLFDSHFRGMESSAIDARIKHKSIFVLFSFSLLLPLVSEYIFMKFHRFFTSHHQIAYFKYIQRASFCFKTAATHACSRTHTLTQYYNYVSLIFVHFAVLCINSFFFLCVRIRKKNHRLININNK